MGLAQVHKTAPLVTWIENPLLRRQLMKLHVNQLGLERPIPGAVPSVSPRASLTCTWWLRVPMYYVL